jgi:hypothetical protein
MAIMRISRFRYSPEKVLAFKHLSDFAQMQPVRERVATGEANRACHCAIAAPSRRRGDRTKFVISLRAKSGHFENPS